MKSPKPQTRPDTTEAATDSQAHNRVTCGNINADHPYFYKIVSNEHGNMDLTHNNCSFVPFFVDADEENPGYDVRKERQRQGKDGI